MFLIISAIETSLKMSFVSMSSTDRKPSLISFAVSLSISWLRHRW